MGIALLIIIFLYYRTWNYKNIIDDNSSRSDYLRVLNMGTQYLDYFEKQRNISYVLVNLATTFGVLLALYLLFGWKVALIYAVLPHNTCGSAWRIGNMYQTTVLLLLTAFFFLQFGVAGAIASACLYYFAMESTVSAIPYICVVASQFLMPFNQATIPLLATILHLTTLGLYISGERFRKGILQRKDHHEDRGIQSFKISPKRFFMVVKVYAYYVYLSLQLWPKLGFYHYFAHKETIEQAETPNRWFWVSFTLLAAFLILGWQISPLGIIWWFFGYSVFSQVIILGQTIAERYMLLPNIGLSLIIATLLKDHPILLTILLTTYFWRTYVYIPAFKSNESLFGNSITQFPFCPGNYNNYGRYLYEKFIKTRNIDLLARARNVFLSGIGVTQGNKSMLWANLSNLYSVDGKWENALECCERALEGASKQVTQDLHLRMADLREEIRKKNRNEGKTKGGLYVP